MDIAKFWILKKCLANARDATVAENAEAAGEKGLTFSIPLDVLVEQLREVCSGWVRLIVESGGGVRQGIES